MVRASILCALISLSACAGLLYTVDPASPAVDISSADSNFSTLSTPIEFGSSSVLTFRIQNSSLQNISDIQAGFTNTNATSPGNSSVDAWQADVSACPSSLATNQSCDVVVTFLSPGEGTFSTELQIQFKDSASQPGTRSQTLSAMGKAATSTVSPAFPLHGANWNDYIVNNPALSVFNQVDTACAGTETTGPSACRHAGELRKVTLPSSISNCQGIRAEDSLNVFYWTCHESGSGAVEIWSTGLQRNHGLRHLVSATGWLKPQLRVYRNEIKVVESDAAAAAWWQNPVVVPTLNDTGAALRLNTAGTIYVIPETRLSMGYNLNADKAAFVVLDGASLKLSPSVVANCDFSSDNGTTYLCLLNVISQKYIWVEGDLAGMNDPSGNQEILLNHIAVKFGRAHGVRVHGSGDHGGIFRGSSESIISEYQGSDNGATGLILDAGNQRNWLRNIRLNNNATQGYGSWNSPNNIIFDMSATNNSGDGIEIGHNGGDRQTLFRTLSANNGSSGFHFWSADMNTIVHAVSTNNGGNGFTNDVGSGSTLFKFAQIATANNSGTGFSFTGVSNYVFSNNLLLGHNNAGDCFVSGGTSPGLNNSCASGAHLVSPVDLSSAFLGAVSTDDANSASSGRTSYSAQNDWFNFSNPFRAWGRDAASQMVSGARSRCSSGFCQIWDWSLSDTSSNPLKNRSDRGDSSNSTFRKGEACPSAVRGDLAITDYNGVAADTFLINAYEIIGDGYGDDDGLCEQGERCIYMPNIGSAQDETTMTGDFTDFSSLDECVFDHGSSSTLTNIRIFSKPAN